MAILNNKFFSRKHAHNQSLLEGILGFRARDKEIYKIALRHRSIIKLDGNQVSNERLEFLGDAVLNTVVAGYLYEQFPRLSEGGLTKMRTRLVNRPFLNDLAVELGIDQLLEKDIGVHEKPKSIYGDALEALIGAVYLDKGYKATTSFVLQRLLNIETRTDSLIKEEWDYKSKCMEWAQQNKIRLEFATTETNGDRKYESRLRVDGLVKSKGQGNTKKEAEQLAAQKFFDRRTADS